MTDEHGNEYLSFGEDNQFVYAEGQVENVTVSPSFTGSYQLERGVLSLQTEDCPEVGEPVNGRSLKTTIN
jgi:hypothetical protein